ncbi:MAG TPA: right-handed parallel beta-helix repeat-containing protein [Candidatus Binatia bacterium]|jgi:hypothetical protein
MNYSQPVTFSVDENLIGAWESRLRDAPAIVTRQAELYPAFADAYAVLKNMPRGARRTLQRKLARSNDVALSARARRTLAASVAGAALLLALSQNTQAATITVNTNIPRIAADGKCSLVEAIINANNDAATHPDCTAGSGADTIVLPAASVHTVPAIYDNTYGARLPAVRSQITIAGNHSRITRKKGKSVSRLLTVAASGDLTLQDVTMTGGVQYFGGAIFNYGNLNVSGSIISANIAFKGGGIANDVNATLVISNSSISGNSASRGGAIFNSGKLSIDNSSFLQNKGYNGAGVLNYGSTNIENSTISGNKAGFRGGGLLIYGGSLAIDNCVISKNTALAGGGIGSFSSLAISNSSITDNRSVYDGGGISNQGNLDIHDSTVSGNRAGSIGGGIAHFDGPLNIENSTVSGNRSTGDVGGGIWNQGTATFSNSTITGNSAKRGGGVFVNTLLSLTLKRSLISGNKASAGAEIFAYANVVADDSNLFGTNGNAGVSGFSPGVSDIVPSGAITNILAPLADNGGPTLTHELVAGSPAIDAAPVDADCPSEDQRGVARPQGALCDIGAFEK